MAADARLAFTHACFAETASIRKKRLLSTPLYS
jgi:hypothetical protein